MRESNPSWLRLLPAGLFLLLLAGAAGVAFTVIHLRQEKARLAMSAEKIRGDLGETGRRLEEMTAAVAMAEEPDTLKARVGNRLQLITEKMTIWVGSGGRPSPTEARPAAIPALTLRLAYAEPATAPGLPR